MRPRRHRRRDRRVQLRQRGLDVVEPVQHRSDQQRMMVVEVPGQRLHQVDPLAAHLPVRQLRHSRRVAVARDQLGEHLPRRDRGHAGRHRGQLDRGVLQDPLQPHRVASAVAHQLHPVAGQVPQPANLRPWHERRRHQPVLEQLRDPLRVLDVGLAPGHRLHVRGVEQPGAHPLLQAVQHRLPVGGRGLHSGQRHTLFDQPVRHRLQRPAHRPVGARLTDPPPALAGGAHADDHHLLADIQSRHPLHQHIHQGLPPMRRHVAPPGGTSAEETDPRALEGNNPAHPRTPRHTLLRAHPHQRKPASPGATRPFSDLRHAEDDLRQPALTRECPFRGRRQHRA